MGAEFCQKLFLHVLRWSYGFYSSVCWCGVPHCGWWKTLASLGWIALDHGVWSFCCIVGYVLLIFCWVFLHLWNYQNSSMNLVKLQVTKLIHRNVLYFYTLTIPFRITQKWIKYLGINLSKETKDLYSKMYKMLMKEIKDTKDGKIYHVHGLEE